MCSGRSYHGEQQSANIHGFIAATAVIDAAATLVRGAHTTLMTSKTHEIDGLRLHVSHVSLGQKTR